MLAVAALVLGAALVFVVLAADFFGAALAVAGFAAVFLVPPADLVAAGFSRFVAF